MIGSSALVQGTSRRRLFAPPALDAVARSAGHGSDLIHYRREQYRPDRTWERQGVVTADATGPAALTRIGRSAALHALVPERDGLRHHVHGPSGWRPLGIVSPPADAVALVARAGGLDALVLSGGAVVHHRGERSGDGSWRWTPQATLATDAVAAPALTAGPGHTLTAAIALSDRTSVLVTSRRSAAPRWSTEASLPPATGTPGLAQRGDVALLALPNGTGFDVHARLASAGAVSVAALTPMSPHAGRPPGGGDGHAGPATARPGTDPTAGPWRPDGHVRCGLRDVAAVSLLASGLDGWFQALTQEGTSLFQWHRQERDGGVRWTRSACLRLDDRSPATIDPAPSIKRAQISGDVDTQPSADGNPRVTLSRSLTRSGVRGTDLGVRVTHSGRDYLLCGDTHWTRPLRTTRDSIAAIGPDGPLPGLPAFTFHGAPIRLMGGRTTMREYDVPLDTFSHRGGWFLFATSNHFLNHQVMGRSVLARALFDPAAIDQGARRPLRFRTLTTVSSRYFVNISCATLPGRTLPGLGVDHDVVALWGSGAYRADDLRLAILDPEPLSSRLAGRRPFPPDALGLRFFAGTSEGVPRWSDRESEAMPLVSGSFGEISVRHVPQIGAYVLLAMSGPEDPIGPCVTLRTSRTPWGPWSDRVVLLDWVRHGMSFDDPSSRFIRASLEASEPVGDRIFRGQRDATGGAYAPYLFDTRMDGDDLVLRYTLSTWNPYQIVLMEHRLAALP